MQIENYWLSYRQGYFIVCIKRFGESRFILRSIGYAHEDWILDAPALGLHDYVIHASTKENAQITAVQVINARLQEREADCLLRSAVRTL